MTKKYNVIGIGNAIVDLMCFVPDQFLKDHALTKSGMFLIDKVRADALSKLKHEKISSGGSVANTIATLSMLGKKTALIGKCGADEFGDLFTHGLKEINCDFICQNKEPDGATAKSFVLITPDGERTMSTYLGNASNIADEINEEAISNAEILYIEGYLWDQPETIAALLKAIKFAKNHNVRVAFTLSDAFCVARHKADFLNLLPDLSILFSNEAEMKLLIGDDFAHDNYKKLVEIVSKKNPNLIVVITGSEKGAVIFNGSEVEIVATTKAQKVIDATGAGDAFAAGFLFGITNKIGLNESANLGNKIAGRVITKVGARLEKDELLNLMK